MDNQLGGRPDEEEDTRRVGECGAVRPAIQADQEPGTYSLAMHLIGVPDASGSPTLRINADHLVSVQPIMRTGERTIVLEAELKVDGMPLLRINLGSHDDRTTAESAFETFLEQLQS